MLHINYWFNMFMVFIIIMILLLNVSDPVSIYILSFVGAVCIQSEFVKYLEDIVK